MKGLKIFGWVCLGLALVCLLVALFQSEWTYPILWHLMALVFSLAAILSLLVTRALKQIREDLELKMLMQS